MTHSMSAELMKLARRPAIWTVVAVWLILGVFFGYLMPYLSYREDPGGTELLSEALPAALPGTAIGGLPVFAGALAIVVGVLAAGSEYGWGTLKVVLTQGPGRVAVVAGKVAVLVLGMLLLVIATFLVDGAASAVVARLAGQPANWPSAGALAAGVAAGWLVASVWCVVGVFLATLLRGSALAVGIGVVWALAVENLLRVATAIPLVDVVQRYLPGSSAGSLVATVGTPLQDAGGTPGVNDAISGPTAVMILMGYGVAFGIGAVALVRRRDVT